jgi:hypothetical protein
MQMMEFMKDTGYKPTPKTMISRHGNTKSMLFKVLNFSTLRALRLGVKLKKHFSEWTQIITNLIFHLKEFP